MFRISILRAINIFYVFLYIKTNYSQMKRCDYKYDEQKITILIMFDLNSTYT